MRRLLLPAVCVLASACRPDFLCSASPRPQARLSPVQGSALSRVDASFARCREALRAGRELDGPSCFDALSAGAQGFLSAPIAAPAEGFLPAAEAEAYLARHVAGLVDEAASDFPSPDQRKKAAEKALRGYRENVLKKHPRAGRYLK